MLIEDRMMFTYGFINSAKNLQALLEKLDSWLVNKKVDVSPKPILFSEWLCDLCQRHEIEPLYVLALIQKEQSAVERTEVPGQRTLDWIVGYGCPESGERYAQFKGFEKQIPCAIKQFDRYERWPVILKWQTTPQRLFDPPAKIPKNCKRISKAEVEGTERTVYAPESKAEAMSFLYNPRYEGVSNLSRIWKKYFSIAKANGLIVDTKRIDGLE